MFADSCLGTGQASVGTIQARQGRQSLYIEPCGCGPWISNSLSALDFLLSCPLIFLPSGPQSPCLCLTLPSTSGAITLYLRSPSFPPPPPSSILSVPLICLNTQSVHLFVPQFSFHLLSTSVSLSLSLSVSACLFSSLPFFSCSPSISPPPSDPQSHHFP